MKRIAITLAASIALIFVACDKDENMVSSDAMLLFLTQADKGVLNITEYTIKFTNGKTWNSHDIAGDSIVHDMKLQEDGVCHAYIVLLSAYGPDSPTLYKNLSWSADVDTREIELYDASIMTAEYEKYKYRKERTKLTLVSYNNKGEFVLRGLQPYALSAESDYDVIIMKGRIETDPAVLEKYNSSMDYFEWKAQQKEQTGFE